MNQKRRILINISILIVLSMNIIHSHSQTMDPEENPEMADHLKPKAYCIQDQTYKELKLDPYKESDTPSDIKSDSLSIHWLAPNGNSKWNYVARCEQGCRVPMLLHITSKGELNIIDIREDLGTMAAKLNCPVPGFYNAWFLADTKGTHFVAFVMNGKASNAILMEVE